MRDIYKIYLIVLLCVFSCKQKSNDSKINNAQKVKETKFYFKNKDPKYLLNPAVNDSLCINEIKRAEEELDKFKGVYVKTICFGCSAKLYDEELKEVVNKREFKFGIQDIGCVIVNGQTQGCYEGFVDLKMRERYGANYKIEIEEEAEQLFIKNINSSDRVISIYDLPESEIPKIKDKKIVIESNYYINMETIIPIVNNNGLSLDIAFIVEKNGTISNLRLANWANENLKNEKYKQDLTNQAIATLKRDYDNWKPGSYKGNIVRTENTLRVHFN